MQQIIIFISLIFSLNFIGMNHPLSMGIIVILQTLIIALLCGWISYSYWFSYILFLTMIGGMLILFIYMTSLASNEMFKFKINFFIKNLILMILGMTFMFYYDNFFCNFKNFETMMFNNMENENLINLLKLYNNPTMNITILLINYLFLTLIIVVKITNINYGPLRQKN
uniref:NADH-ubiquinone oxidoreductase chain 6 n=1 Tax=Drepanepteryx phalaenoides TaxID=560898 RepID=A0A1S5QYP1_9NEOP|nr:NADH dehydrogenase subunit 6 [Drepanepteryx phalaenoides]